MDVLELIRAAHRKLGVAAEGEVLSSASSADGLTALNDLVDSWKTERLMIYTVTRTTWTIVANDGSYTVGSSGDVNIAWPWHVDHVNYIDTDQDPDLELPLGKLTEDAYAAIGQKALTATFPTHYYYNPTWTLGTLTLWPVPTSSALTGALYHPTAVSEFTGLSQTVSLPPGYRRALIHNLALELAPDYGVQINGALLLSASKSKDVLKRLNFRMQDASFDPGCLGSGASGVGYDINAGP